MVEQHVIKQDSVFQQSPLLIQAPNRPTRQPKSRLAAISAEQPEILVSQSSTQLGSPPVNEPREKVAQIGSLWKLKVDAKKQIDNVLALQAIEERMTGAIPAVDDRTIAEEIADILKNGSKTVEEGKASPFTALPDAWTIANIGIPCDPIHSNVNFSIAKLGLLTDTIQKIQLEAQNSVTTQSQPISEVSYNGVPSLFSETLVEAAPTSKVVEAEDTIEFTKPFELEVKESITNSDTSLIPVTTISSEYDLLFESFNNDEELATALSFTIKTPFTEYGPLFKSFDNDEEIATALQFSLTIEDIIQPREEILMEDFDYECQLMPGVFPAEENERSPTPMTEVTDYMVGPIPGAWPED